MKKKMLGKGGIKVKDKEYSEKSARHHAAKTAKRHRGKPRNTGMGTC